ncbi:hypothetical protein ALC62_05114 [Cyphomyrmex costatus]|uniref:Uncharacterized protein n=1 Tax=Cyphomyrmex costatus TaxID=456900 RepID=A0A195CUI8_9HYME|nr:hypothetical protein ALC62_05114 [Cyphomyrmex costatus]
MNEENAGVQGQMVDTYRSEREATANESKRASEQDTTRKDDTKNDDTVGGLGYRTETFSKVTGSGGDHALRCTCLREAAK